MSYCYTVLHGGFRDHSGGTQQIPGIEAGDGRKSAASLGCLRSDDYRVGRYYRGFQGERDSRPTIRAGIAEVQSGAPAAEEGPPPRSAGNDGRRRMVRAPDEGPRENAERGG